jgi:hypothetical protein
MSSSIPGDTTTQVSGIVEGVIFVPSLLLKVDAKRSSLYHTSEKGMHLCSGYLLNPLFICVLDTCWDRYRFKFSRLNLWICHTIFINHNDLRSSCLTTHSNHRIGVRI